MRRLRYPARLGAAIPQDVHEAILRADEASARLAAEGRQIEFAVDDQTGRVEIEVRDAQGRLISTLTPSELFDLLDGSPGVNNIGTADDAPSPPHRSATDQ